MRVIWLSLWVVLALALTTPSLADGEGSEAEQLNAARALADAGFKLYEGGDYAGALSRFKAAEGIYHAPPHLLFMGRCQDKLGKLVEAKQLYQQLVDEDLGDQATGPFGEAQAEGRQALEALAGRIPTLQVTLEGTDASLAAVSIDGQPVAAEALADPIEVNPGEHRLVLEVAGHEPAETTVTVEEGTAGHPVTLPVGPATAEEAGPAPPPDEEEAPSIVPPLIVAGVGVAAIGVGVVTGILTLDDAAELKDRCPDNPCPEDNESLADSVNTLGTVSTIGFVVGGAAIGAGVLWLLLQPNGPTEEAATAQPAVEFLVGPTALGVRGTF